MHCISYTSSDWSTIEAVNESRHACLRSFANLSQQAKIEVHLQGTANLSLTQSLNATLQCSLQVDSNYVTEIPQSA